MHPEIKKFWQDSGYEIQSDTHDMENGHIDTLWWGYPKDVSKDNIQLALMADDWDSPVYLLSTQAYEEDYMIRIVRLKAFL
jgi:hypothetical protein